MKKTLLATALLLLFCGCTSTHYSSAKDDWNKLQGTWQVIRHTNLSGEVPPDAFQSSILEIADGRMILRSPRGDKVIEGSSFSIQAVQRPKHINCDMGHGIYKFAGNKLFLCVGREHPTKFKGGDGNVELYVLKRVKKN